MKTDREASAGVEMALWAFGTLALVLLIMVLGGALMFFVEIPLDPHIR